VAVVARSPTNRDEVLWDIHDALAAIIDMMKTGYIGEPPANATASAISGVDLFTHSQGHAVVFSHG